MRRLCSSRFERAARQLGWMRIAGLDEAGRGALFGPVVAAAVILNPKRRIVGLDDSKKLPAERRAELAVRIHEHALAWAVAEIDAQRIDAWNIYQASRQAMTAALEQLSIQNMASLATRVTPRPTTSKPSDSTALLHFISIPLRRCATRIAGLPAPR